MTIPHPVFFYMQGFGDPEAQGLVVTYRALHDTPPRLPSQPQYTTAGDSSEGAGLHEGGDSMAGGTPRGTPRGGHKPGQLADRANASEAGVLSNTTCAAISRYLLLCSPLGKGRGQFLRWLVDAGSRSKVSWCGLYPWCLGNMQNSYQLMVCNAPRHGSLADPASLPVHTCGRMHRLGSHLLLA
jgi:hypothetical protein